MNRFIIDRAGTGKTKKLLELAKEFGAIVVCRNPNAMMSKAHAYGITGLHYMDYDSFIRTKNITTYNDTYYVIDEIGDLINYLVGGNLYGFTMTVE